MGRIDIMNKRIGQTGNNDGFTLGEIMFVLLIIGMITKMVILPFMINVKQNVYTQANEVELVKLHEATDQMKAANALSGYDTNEAFVDAFSKYMKVMQRCTWANLNDCFAAKINTGSKTVVPNTDLINGKDLGQMSNTSTTVGLVLVDGTSMLLAYKPDCVAVGPYDLKTDTTTCMSVVYDTNGKGGENTVGKDIQLLNASISPCDIRIGNGAGLCLAGGDSTYTADGTYMELDNSQQPNMWAGAIKQCTAQGMRLPSKEELSTIYQNRATISGLSLTIYYWSALEDSEWEAWGQYFGAAGWKNPTSKNYGAKARCVR